MSLPFEITDRNFLLQVKKMREQVIAGKNGKPFRSVLLTSITKGHGVSTVAANLAYSLSKLSDSKVLIVDGNNAKLSNVTDIESSLQKPLAQNLYAIKLSLDVNADSGVKFKERFKALSDNFSHVILDLPAFTQVPEVLSLISMVDLVLLVVQAGTTKWQVISREQETIEDAQPQNLKVVLNRKKHYIPNTLYRWM